MPSSLHRPPERDPAPSVCLWNTDERREAEREAVPKKLGTTHPEFATYRDTPEGMSMARELAEARGGVSIAALLRMLVREEYRRADKRARKQQETEQ